MSPCIKLIHQQVESKLKGTKFSWKKCSIDISSKSNKYDILQALWNSNHNSSGNFHYLDVTCPWGNKFRIHEGHQGKPHVTRRTNDPVDTTPLEDAFPYLQMRGGIGLAYIEFLIPHNTVHRVANFYSKFLGAPSVVVDSTCFVTVGPSQNLIFKETKEGEKIENPGHHVAIYVSNFGSTFKKMQKHNLIYVSPVAQDQIADFKEAMRWKQFRFKDFVDEESNEVFYSLEHEVRSLGNPGFMRPLVNRFGFCGMYCNQ